MKLSLLISLLLIATLQGWTQDQLGKPIGGQVGAQPSIPPGTVKIEISPLVSTWKDASCRQDMQQMGVKVVQVVDIGSGIINPLNAGDSINIRLLKGMAFDPETLHDGDTLLLKEQLCSFEKTYYSLIKKE